MKKIPPIPKELLIHTIEYYEYDSNSRYGDDWKEPVTVEFVRVEPNRAMQNSVPFDEIESVIGVTIFYDCTHSTPINVVTKSKIVWNSREMYLNSFDEMYGIETTPHHKVLACT